ncbi:MAG: 2-amino-4-oxopentanoate thiolase subunit OrtA [Firmicutes bacterium]|nr:2-amino-4-oxopentanoate thiolase subunit OrtA [Bacillota bacterium]
MKKAEIGDWVQIHQIVLKPEERGVNIPDDTKNVPLELWVKGFAQNEATIGEEIRIKTVTGRMISGTLHQVNPKYIHNFGEYVPELTKIDMQLKEILFGGEADD